MNCSREETGCRRGGLWTVILLISGALMLAAGLIIGARFNAVFVPFLGPLSVIAAILFLMLVVTIVIKTTRNTN